MITTGGRSETDRSQHAILVFGVSASVEGLNLVAIGYILMAGGLLVILLSLVVFMSDWARSKIRRCGE